MANNPINKSVILTVKDGDEEIARLHLGDYLADLLRNGRVLDIRLGGFDGGIMIVEATYFPDRQPPAPLGKTVKI